MKLNADLISSLVALHKRRIARDADTGQLLYDPTVTETTPVHKGELPILGICPEVCSRILEEVEIPEGTYVFRMRTPVTLLVEKDGEFVPHLDTAEYSLEKSSPLEAETEKFEIEPSLSTDNKVRLLSSAITSRLSDRVESIRKRVEGCKAMIGIYEPPVAYLHRPSIWRIRVAYGSIPRQPDWAAPEMDDIT